jgi:hypothetical protein
MNRTLALLAVVIGVVVAIGLSPTVSAQGTVAKESETTVKATIDSIDHDLRNITFKDKDGNYQTIHAGPEVRRFEELKVGDVVTVRTTKSTVYKIRKPGQSVPESTKDVPAVVRGAGEKPSATVTEQSTSNVTVKSIDMKRPSLTVVDENGRTRSYVVKDKGELKGINPGDTIVIYYTMAKAISVE